MPQHRDAVLQTTELLENILAQLDIRTLLTSAQLVNQRWHEVIAQSPRLQEALYFKPAAAPAASDASRSLRTRNPLLAEVFPFWFPEIQDDDDDEDEDQDYSSVFWDEPRKKQGSTKYWKHDFESLRLVRDEKHRKACMHPDASWRRMLVRQPPVFELGRWYHTHAMSGDDHDFCVFHFPNGLRMGYLYDEVVKSVIPDPTGFSMLWRNPRVKPQLGDLRYRRLDPEQHKKLDAFCGEVELVVHFSVTISCCLSSPNREELQFEQAITHPRAERAAQIQQDLEWFRKFTDRNFDFSGDDSTEV